MESCGAPHGFEVSGRPHTTQLARNTHLRYARVVYPQVELRGGQPVLLAQRERRLADGLVVDAIGVGFVESEPAHSCEGWVGDWEATSTHHMDSIGRSFAAL